MLMVSDKTMLLIFIKLCKQSPLEIFFLFIFIIYQNYTLALSMYWKGSGYKYLQMLEVYFTELT